MKFTQLFDPESSTYTYVLVDDISQQAIIIDPVKSLVKSYLSFFEKMGCHLSIAMDTHLHADHITATGELQDVTHCRIIMGRSKATENLCETLNDGEQLQVGELTLTALYTPGHTDDSYCYLMSDRIFTGDTLLIGGTGRTDFQHGDAGKAYDNLLSKVLCLADATLVYPAHDYKGNTVSTIGYEKINNPRLQVKSREEYIQLMGNLNLPKPGKMDIAVPANQKLGRI